MLLTENELIGSLAEADLYPIRLLNYAFNLYLEKEQNLGAMQHILFF